MSDFEFVDIDYEDTSGYEKYYITVDDIAALLSGKALWAVLNGKPFEIILERGKR